MGEIFLSISRMEHGLFHLDRFMSNGSPTIVGRYTSTLPVFGSRARGFDWNLVGNVGQILLLQKKTCVLNTFEETLSESEQNH